MNILNPTLDFDLAACLATSRDLFCQWERDWRGDEKGIDRGGYSNQETGALDVLGKAALQLGMHVYEDVAGNRYHIYPGADPSLPVILMMSHVDAVFQGGRYDGTAGLALALNVVEAHQSHYTKTQERPLHTLVMLACRTEESARFAKFGIGSGIITGKQGPDILALQAKDKPLTLEDCMRQQGIDTQLLRKVLEARQPLVPLDLIKMAFEAHIEQGPVLVKKGISLAAVTGIRGNLRMKEDIVFTGRADHTGATDVGDRKDAGRASRIFMAQVEGNLSLLEAAGHDLTCTLYSDTDKNFTTVPEHARVRIEVRSTRPDILELSKEIILAALRHAEKITGVTNNFNETKFATVAPQPMTPALTEELVTHAQALGISIEQKHSGAGHDIMLFGDGKGGSDDVPRTMLFFRNDEGSHNPRECLGLYGQDPFSVEGDFAKGLQVAARFIAAQAGRRLYTGPLPRPDHITFVNQLTAQRARPAYIPR
jgi:N-carbamoyl-L-amino-acid hydrolase